MEHQAPKTTWEVLPSLPTLRAYSAAVSHNGLIYVIGGCDQRGQPLNAVEVYEPTSKKWRSLPSLKVKRAQLCANMYKKKIVVTGGCKELNQAVTEVCFGIKSTVDCFASDNLIKKRLRVELYRYIRKLEELYIG